MDDIFRYFVAQYNIFLTTTSITINSLDCLPRAKEQGFCLLVIDQSHYLFN